MEGLGYGPGGPRIRGWRGVMFGPLSASVRGCLEIDWSSCCHLSRNTAHCDVVRDIGMVLCGAITATLSLGVLTR